MSFEEYKELFQSGFNNADLNRYILFNYIKNPLLVQDLIDGWIFHDDKRDRIIMQAADNYYQGNYEICVLALLLQIEGLMRDKLQLKLKEL